MCYNCLLNSNSNSIMDPRVLVVSRERDVATCTPQFSRPYTARSALSLPIGASQHTGHSAAPRTAPTALPRIRLDPMDPHALRTRTHSVNPHQEGYENGGQVAHTVRAVRDRRPQYISPGPAPPRSRPLETRATSPRRAHLHLSAGYRPASVLRDPFPQSNPSGRVGIGQPFLCLSSP